MATKKIKINTKMDDVDIVRHHFDEKTDKWYFSVVDVMGIVTESTDARNYWKVLKNRLKKADNELVTNCNQLKMRAKDGKYYLTDMADVETMLQIIKTTSPGNVERFHEYFETFLANNANYKNNDKKEEKKRGEAKLLVDVYQTSTNIIIETMIAGVSVDDISISITENKVVIRGKRNLSPSESFRLSPGPSPKDYLHQELQWFNFYRRVSLPFAIEKDEVETTEENGYLKIKLPKKISRLPRSQ